MEYRTPVQPVRVDAICEKCGTGYMRRTMGELHIPPRAIPHACLSCGHEALLSRQYPYIEFKESVVSAYVQTVDAHTETR